MGEAGTLEYAQARIQARYGSRPDEAAWRRLEAAREMRTLSDLAQASGFMPWMAGLVPSPDVHRIEAGLRRRWRLLVADVARWMPQEWSGAISWCSLLIDLPAVDHLLRDGPVQAWMREDPALAPLCGDDAQARRRALEHGPFAPLAAAAGLPEAWLAEWRRRWPAGDRDEARLLEDCVKALAVHRAAFQCAAPGTAWPLRRSLQGRLETLFRRAALTPGAAFLFLLLSALDLERLRGELSLRAAFPVAERAP